MSHITQERNTPSPAGGPATPHPPAAPATPVSPDRRPRPFTARSVLASTLLGTDPPELPVSHLVRLAGLFGISGNRARVALSRMVAAGEVTTVGDGRYRLAGHLDARGRRQLVSRAGVTGPWSGAWHLVAVVSSGSPASERSRRRAAFTYARLAELRDGVWMRPANLPLDLGAIAPDDVEVLEARPPDPERLAGRMWDLDGRAARARELAGALEGAPPDAGSLADGFVLAAAVLRHLQADPLLPVELLPAGWPGARLRSTFDDWDRRYRALLASWARGDRPA